MKEAIKRSFEAVRGSSQRKQSEAAGRGSRQRHSDVPDEGGNQEAVRGTPTYLMREAIKGKSGAVRRT